MSSSLIQCLEWWLKIWGNLWNHSTSLHNIWLELMTPFTALFFVDFCLSEGTAETRLLHSLTCFKERQGIHLVVSNVLARAPQSWPWTPPITPRTLHWTLLTTAPLSIDAQQKPPLIPPFTHPDGLLMNLLTSTPCWCHCTHVCGTPRKRSPNRPRCTSWHHRAQGAWRHFFSNLVSRHLGFGCGLQLKWIPIYYSHTNAHMHMHKDVLYV